MQFVGPWILPIRLRIPMRIPKKIHHRLLKPRIQFEIGNLQYRCTQIKQFEKLRKSVEQPENIFFFNVDIKLKQIIDHFHTKFSLDSSGRFHEQSTFSSPYMRTNFTLVVLFWTIRVWNYSLYFSINVFTMHKHKWSLMNFEWVTIKMSMLSVWTKLK